jgi:transcriptional regulator with XRE-family HTH domain
VATFGLWQARFVAKELGSRIRALREQMGLTAAGLARRAGIDPAALLRIERGDNTNPSFATIARIADALDLSLDVFRSAKGRRSVKTTDVDRIRREEDVLAAYRLVEEAAKHLERASRQ